MRKYYSSKLLNYIEPFEIQGYLKSAFYSEINTNISVGDKMYILNGNYDSNDYIKNLNYTMGVDGYTVLDVDRCRIVLDIDYTGILPYKSDSYDNFIKIHYIQNQREFDYINKIYVNRNQSLISKFEYQQSNDIIYAPSSFQPITQSHNGQNNGIGVVGKLWQFNSSTLNWIDVTDDFMSNNLTFSSNNGNVIIRGSDFSIDGIDFSMSNYYKFDNSWVNNSQYKVAMISKLNFRNGTFNGVFNDGIFGTYDEKVEWNNKNSVWNSGIFVNSVWNGDQMNSKSISSDQSYYSSIDKFGLPVQTTDYLNNNGFGYNYIIESNINSGVIFNGNIQHTKLLTQENKSSISIYKGLTQNTYPLTINGGSYEMCDIKNVTINNSSIIRSNVSNVIGNNIDLVESQIFESVSNNSKLGVSAKYNKIKIEKSDIQSYIPTYLQQSVSSIKGILKLYITQENWESLRNFNSFYLTNLNKDSIINLISIDDKISLPYEFKYTIDNFNELDSPENNITVTLKSSKDNLTSVVVSKSGLTFSNVFATHSTSMPSIDIDFGKHFGYYSENGENIYLNNNVVDKNRVNDVFTNTEISLFNYESGIVENSIWDSVSHINESSNKISLDSSNSLVMSISGTNSISLTLSERENNIKDNSLSVNSWVFINNASYELNGTIYSLPENLKILSNTSIPNGRILQIIEVGTSIISTLPTNGKFITSLNNVNYASVNKLIIKSSKINSGFFKRSLIIDSEINGENIDSLNQSDIKKLRLTNISFLNTNNIINGGVIHKSHINDVLWNGGVAYNTIWNKAILNKGLFTNGYWIDGTMNGGEFTNSSDISLSLPSYDKNTYYKMWKNGTMNGGQFTKSTWVDGTINGGSFLGSTWYGGIWNDGILGDKNISSLDTKMGYYNYLGFGATSTVFNGGIVENASVGGSGSVYWNNGVFNGGQFTSFGSNYPTESIWNNGEFNGSLFTGMARWKNGIFNNGKFNSHYGWTMSSSTFSYHYSWENGKFNSGQFGESSYGTNSTWFDGEFNDGIFKGKVWNNGILHKGRFIGGSTYSSMTNSQEFTASYKTSYYGLWRNGWVIDVLSTAKPGIKIFEKIFRAKETKINPTVSFENALWLSGTFSHPNGTMINSIWLDGIFKNGTFKDSSFNPYVDRTLGGSASVSSFNFSNTCYWENGTFNNGEFNISEWRNGTWVSGTMSGGVWRNGIWNYGYANNIYWENGIWKNGNWDGSPFNYNSVDESTFTMKNGREKDILMRISKITNNNNIHLINSFTGSVIIPECLGDPSLEYGFGQNNGVYGWTSSGNGPQWQTGTSYPVNQILSILDKHIKVTSSTQSSTLYAMSGNTTEVFTSTIIPFGPYGGLQVNYGISVTIAVDGATSSFKITAGNVSTQETMYPNYYTLPNGVVKSYVSTKTFTLNYAPTDLNSLTSKQLRIQKLQFSTSNELGTVRVINASVNMYVIKYDIPNNNIQYPSIPVNTNYTDPVLFPPLLLKTIVNKTSSAINIAEQYVGLKFGNGTFKSGIWENGVWNNGWRDDKTVVKFSSIYQYLKITENIWRIQLTCIDNVVNGLKVGDKVSMSNIVGIDINEKRKLISDYVTIIRIIGSYIIVQLVTNFPYRRIEIDSTNHLIFISKNIWLSGVFLNGYFEGVWNYGLFKGNPYITKMDNCHFVNGIFDGGHFVSRKDTYNDFNGNTVEYNTGLVQNFIFKDNNIGNPYEFKYGSWMDVNYDNQQMSNIGKEFINYDPATTTEYVDSNLNGYITNDILSSESYFRDGYSNNIKSYKLGIKYTKYEDFLTDENGEFNQYFNNQNETKFRLAGWTHSEWFNNTTSYSFSYSQKVGDPRGILKFDSTINQTGLSFTHKIGSSKLTNINTSDINDKRYSMIEFNLTNFSGGATSYDGNVGSIFSQPTTYPSIYLNNRPATYSSTLQNINHVANGLGVKKEYFYNRQSIDMSFIVSTGPNSSSTNSYEFDYIKMYEIDMIPFFKYLTEGGGFVPSTIDNSIKAPYKGVSPIINYNLSGYNLIGSVTITKDTQIVNTYNQLRTDIQNAIYGIGIRNAIGLTGP